MARVAGVSAWDGHGDTDKRITAYPPDRWRGGGVPKAPHMAHAPCPLEQGRATIKPGGNWSGFVIELTQIASATVATAAGLVIGTAVAGASCVGEPSRGSCRFLSSKGCGYAQEIPCEVHDRADPMALDRLNDYASVWAARQALAPKPDVGAKTLRKWIVP